jgi:hypothetical protein
MEPTVRYAGERNGYSIKVYEYTNKGKQRFGSKVVSLTTGNSAQFPGWTMYKTALEVAQEAADKALI